MTYLKQIFFIISILSLILFVIFIIYDFNAFVTFSLFLSMILFGNLSGLMKEKEQWNNGVCGETGEFWEYDTCAELSDESQMFIFKSKQYCYCSQYLMLEQLRKDFKGNNNF